MWSSQPSHGQLVFDRQGSRSCDDCGSCKQLKLAVRPAEVSRGHPSLKLCTACFDTLDQNPEVWVMPLHRDHMQEKLTSLTSCTDDHLRMTILDELFDRGYCKGRSDDDTVTASRLRERDDEIAKLKEKLFQHEQADRDRHTANSSQSATATQPGPPVRKVVHKRPSKK